MRRLMPSLLGLVPSSLPDPRPCRSDLLNAAPGEGTSPTPGPPAPAQAPAAALASGIGAAAVAPAVSPSGLRRGYHAPPTTTPCAPGALVGTAVLVGWAALCCTTKVGAGPKPASCIGGGGTAGRTAEGAGPGGGRKRGGEGVLAAVEPPSTAQRAARPHGHARTERAARRRAPRGRAAAGGHTSFGRQWHCVRTRPRLLPATS